MQNADKHYAMHYIYNYIYRGRIWIADNGFKSFNMAIRDFQFLTSHVVELLDSDVTHSDEVVISKMNRSSFQ